MIVTSTAAATSAEAATEACAPMFVLLTGSQPVVISFVQQRALSHVPHHPLFRHHHHHPTTNHHPLAEQKQQQRQRQRQQNAVSFPFSVSFPVRPKLPLFPQFSTSRTHSTLPFPLGPESARSPPVSLKRRASGNGSGGNGSAVLLDRGPVAGSAVRPF